MTNVNENSARSVSLDSFRVLDLLGSGGFANVFKVRKLHGSDKNKLYAMKVINKEFLVCRSKDCERKDKLLYVDGALREKGILARLNHPFIIKMNYALQNEGNLCLMLEFARGGHLGTYLDRVKKLSDASAAFYMSQIILAVKYLHAQGIIHRDIKLENILLASNGYIKLSDFGVSGYEASHSPIGTLNYMAPEMLRRDRHEKEVDWWALGIVLYTLIRGRYPFDNEDDAVLIQTIIAVKYCLPDYLTFSAKNLIRGLLKADPKQRLGAEGAAQIMEQDFFMNTCWKSIMDQTKKPPFMPKKKSKFVKFKNRLLEDENKEIVSSLNDPAGEIVKKDNYLFKNFTFIG